MKTTSNWRVSKDIIVESNKIVNESGSSLELNLNPSVSKLEVNL